MPSSPTDPFTLTSTRRYNVQYPRFRDFKATNESEQFQHTS
jgi:hypothetical protein